MAVFYGRRHTESDRRVIITPGKSLSILKLEVHSYNTITVFRNS